MKEEDERRIREAKVGEGRECWVRKARRKEKRGELRKESEGGKELKEGGSVERGI